MISIDSVNSVGSSCASQSGSSQDSDSPTITPSVLGSSNPKVASWHADGTQPEITKTAVAPSVTSTLNASTLGDWPTILPSSDWVIGGGLVSGSRGKDEEPSSVHATVRIPRPSTVAANIR